MKKIEKLLKPPDGKDVKFQPSFTSSNTVETIVHDALEFGQKNSCPEDKIIVRTALPVTLDEH